MKSKAKMKVLLCDAHREMAWLRMALLQEEEEVTEDGVGDARTRSSERVAEAEALEHLERSFSYSEHYQGLLPRRYEHENSYKCTSSEGSKISEGDITGETGIYVTEECVAAIISSLGDEAITWRSF